MKKNKGFTLIELILALGVGVMASFIKFQDMRNEQDLMKASAAGEQIQRIGYAVNNYISLRYDKLSTLTSSSSQSNDPGPRICSGDTCTITIQTLKNDGILPNSYVDSNAFKSPYSIVIKRTGSSPNYVLDAMITTSAAWIESGNNPRYDLLGFAMQKAGIDSGMTKSNTKADGYNGSWSEQSSSFNNITKPGQLAFRAGYNASLYSAFLRRDGTLPMTGNLNMGGKDIYNAKDMTASGNASFSGKGDFGGNITSGGTVTAAGQVIAHNGYGDTISFGGDAHADDYEITMAQDKPLSIHMASNRSDITALKITGGLATTGNGSFTGELGANGNITAGKQIIGHNGGGDTFYIGGGDANDYEFRLGSVKPLTLWRSGGLSNEQRLQVWGRQDNIGDLSVRGDGNSQGYIIASGNITSSETVSGKYLKANSVSVAGASCPSNGMISQNNEGRILSCVNGQWKGIGSKGYKIYSGSGGKIALATASDHICSILSWRKYGNSRKGAFYFTIENGRWYVQNNGEYIQAICTENS